MARNQEQVLCPEEVWTEITNADVTNITFQAKGDVFIAFTAGATAPTELTGIHYELGQGESNKALADVTSLSGANRVWAKPIRGQSYVLVDHA